MDGSMGQRDTFGIAHNISSAEEKVDSLKSERLMDEDLSVLSIRSIWSTVRRTLVGCDERHTDIVPGEPVDAGIRGLIFLSCTT
jgi:hypothetical protein